MSSSTVYSSRAEDDAEWREDLKELLMWKPGLIKNRISGMIDLFHKYNGSTGLSISVDAQASEVSIVKAYETVKTVPFDKIDELIEFLEAHIKKVMKFRLEDVSFRAVI